ncbi:uncharacterized protein [Rutidosis leptorrhynchoides]|uniref:uncharacterized protein n=1 Tax=Rutidosis leptorrhynchoides TaxID=125765 RepID=UPI003A99C3D9
MTLFSAIPMFIQPRLWSSSIDFCCSCCCQACSSCRHKLQIIDALSLDWFECLTSLCTMYLLTMNNSPGEGFRGLTMSGDEGEASTTMISRLDYGNPLYLHASHISSTPLINFKHKGTEKFKSWACAIELALQTKNKLGFINGTLGKDEEDDVLSNQWESCNAVVLSWILGCVSDELYYDQIYSKLAFVVWEEFREAYDKVDGFVLFNLEQKISLLTHNGTLRKLMKFLMGLDDSYRPVRTTILTSDPLPSVKAAFNIISREKSHRGVHDKKSITESSAFFSNTGTTYLTLSNEQIAKLVNPLDGKSAPAHSSSNMTDSGANQHMTNSSKGFEVVNDVLRLNLTVGHPNGIKVKVKQIGNLRISKDLVLYDVLVVPDYCDLVTNKTLVTGSLYDGLYIFSDSNKGECHHSNLQLCMLSKSTWHSRLSHPTDQVLNILRNELNFVTDNSSIPCDVCHKAKQTREPFPLSDHKSTHLGELIHLDVCGPYMVTSRDRFKYFLTVVDDYTRAVWVFLLKSKEEVCFYVELFHEQLFTQFQKRIKMIRSDNGSEFLNTNMTNFTIKNGIIHLTSCVYTPQQNGIVERKHRHLLNVARSLMFQGEYL